MWFLESARLPFVRCFTSADIRVLACVSAYFVFKPNRSSSILILDISLPLLDRSLSFQNSKRHRAQRLRRDRRICQEYAISLTQPAHATVALVALVRFPHVGSRAWCSPLPQPVALHLSLWTSTTLQSLKVITGIEKSQDRFPERLHGTRTRPAASMWSTAQTLSQVILKPTIRRPHNQMLQLVVLMLKILYFTRHTASLSEYPFPSAPPGDKIFRSLDPQTYRIFQVIHEGSKRKIWTLPPPRRR